MTIITLTTDFGLSDWFVGTMKGVILSILPETVLVDLTHDIPAGNIAAGAFALAAGCQFFPRGTIHLAIVDPGVGSHRGALVVETESYFFVGPDNGLLTLALAHEKIRSIHRLENQDYLLKPFSRTFHGRDVFAPAAAHLGCGIPPASFGTPLEDYQRLPLTPVEEVANDLLGSVVYIDKFGNAITNIPESRLPTFGKAQLEIAGSDSPKQIPLGYFYQETAAGEAIVVPGSSGFLEIAINGGNAAQTLSLEVGMTVTLRRFKPS